MSNCIPCASCLENCTDTINCIKTELTKIYSEAGDVVLDNFCSTAVKCVDDELEKASQGLAHGLSFFCGAQRKCLTYLPGYQSTGQLVLAVDEGDMSWTSINDISPTVVTSGLGIDVTGDGSSGTPYAPNINAAYVRGLFSAGTGLTYNSGTGQFSLNSVGAFIENQYTLDQTANARITGSFRAAGGFSVGTSLIPGLGLQIVKAFADSHLIRLQNNHNAGATAIAFYNEFSTSKFTVGNHNSSFPVLPNSNVIDSSGSTFHIAHNNIPRLTVLNPNGLIGLNEPSPTGTVQVTGVNGNYTLRLKQAATSPGHAIIVDSNSGSGGDIFLVDNAGKVKIVGDGGNAAELIGRDSSDFVTPVVIGSGLSLSGGTLSCTVSSGSTYTDEQAQDAALGAITLNNGLTGTYNDGANTYTGKLGGPLIENTLITGAAGTHSLSFTGLLQFTAQLQGSSSSLQLSNTHVSIGNSASGGYISAIGGIRWESDNTPAQLTSNTNDWAITGLSGYSILRVSSDAERNLTGIAGGNDGQLHYIVNVGSNDIVLKDENVGSSAVNRFALPGDIVLPEGSGIPILYDGTSSRWRMIGTPHGKGRLLKTTVFTASGTWVKPANCNAVMVVVVAGGGGSNGAQVTVGGNAAVSSGGGAGSSSVYYITSGLGSTETVTVGIGGSGGNAGNSYIGQNGTASSFGSHASSTAGQAGTGITEGTSVAMAVGGVAVATSGSATGKLYFSGGEAGEDAIRLSGTVAVPGRGGVSLLGGGGNYSPGAGGTGVVRYATGNSEGNNGGNGIVIVYEYS